MSSDQAFEGGFYWQRLSSVYECACKEWRHVFVIFKYKKGWYTLINW